MYKYTTTEIAFINRVIRDSLSGVGLQPIEIYPVTDRASEPIWSVVVATGHAIIPATAHEAAAGAFCADIKLQTTQPITSRVLRMTFVVDLALATQEMVL